MNKSTSTCFVGVSQQTFSFKIEYTVDSVTSLIFVYPISKISNCVFAGMRSSGVCITLCFAKFIH